MTNGIPWSVQMLRHLEALVHHKPMLKGPKRQIQIIVYEDIHEDLVKKAARKTKGGCGPSGFDKNNWCRILVFNQFNSTPLHLQTSIANFVKCL